MEVAFWYKSMTSTFTSPPSLRSTWSSIVFRVCHLNCSTYSTALFNLRFNSLQIRLKASLKKLLIVSVSSSNSVFDVEVARLLIFNFPLQVPLPFILKSSDLFIVKFWLQLLCLETLSLLHLLQKKFVLTLNWQRVEGHFRLFEGVLSKTDYICKILQLRVFGFLMQRQTVG